MSTAAKQLPTQHVTLQAGRKGQKVINVNHKETYAPSPAPRAALDTYGWDSVYAMRFADINQVIANTTPEVYPLTFAQTDVPAPQPFNYRIDGSFAAWRLAAGGSGQIVCMELPIPALTYEKAGDTPEVHANVTATIKLRLEDLPQPSTATSIFKKTGNVVELRFPTSANGDVIDSVSCSYTDSPPDAEGQLAINSLLMSWLNDNCDDFNLVFATINLNAEAGVEDLDWLMPTHVSYAVRDETFAVLCMTEERTPSRVHDLSPDVIPEGQQSGFVISMERYFEKIMLPSTYLLFDQASADDFHVIENGSKLTNKNDIMLGELLTDDGESFKPKIAKGKFTVRFEGEELHMRIEDMRYTIDSTLGPYDVVMTTDSYGVATLGDDGILDVLQTNATADGQIDASMKRRLIEIAVPVVAAIAGALLAFVLAPAAAAGAAEAGAAAAAGEAAAPAVAAGMSANAWALLGGIVGALLGGLWPAILILLEERSKGQATSSPTLDTLLEDAVTAVQWPGTTHYTIRNARFNNGLQIGIERTLLSAAADNHQEQQHA